MRTFLTQFTSFRTRYYRSEDGKKSQRWLKEQLEKVVSKREDITVKEFPHPWGQSSIIVHIPRRRKSSSFKSDDSIVIISAHQDSTNLLPFLPAPGADDDGSGTSTVFEVLNVLMEHDFAPTNSSVEFHFYSAEEGGLLGSQAVAQAYHQDGKSVKAMLQLDMTAYIKPGSREQIGIITDFVDTGLTELLFKLVDEYATIPAVPTKYVFLPALFALLILAV
jgi:leucyl aminopeptidase